MLIVIELETAVTTLSVRGEWRLVQRFLFTFGRSRLLPSMNSLLETPPQQLHDHCLPFKDSMRLPKVGSMQLSALSDIWGMEILTHG